MKIGCRGSTLAALLAALSSLPGASALAADAGAACAACESVPHRLDGGFVLMLPVGFTPTARLFNGDGVVDSEPPLNQATQYIPRIQVMWGYRSPAEAATQPCPVQGREVRIIEGRPAARAIRCEFDGAMPGERLVFYSHHYLVSVETLPLRSAGRVQRSDTFVLRVDYHDPAERELARRIADSLRFQPQP